MRSASLTSSFQLERPPFSFLLQFLVLKNLPDQTFRIIYCIHWIVRRLILSRLANQSIFISKGHVWWSGPATKVVRNNLNLIIFHNCNDAISSTEINSDPIACPLPLIIAWSHPWNDLFTWILCLLQLRLVFFKTCIWIILLEFNCVIKQRL